MPIYEYQCERCGTVTDIKHGFKETTSEACPKCGGPLKRLFNAAGIVFKGSGFYVNDSRASPGGGQAKADKPEKSESGAGKSESGSGKSESGSGKSEAPAPKTDGGGKSDAAA